MILCDREIRAALARQAIRITPDPTVDASLWSSTALDLHLGDHLSRWDFTRPGAPACFSPADPDHDLLDLIARFTHSQVIPETGARLEPGSFWLGWTLQAVQLPHRSRIAARVEGKSSLARLGMGVHVTAPTVHAGFGYNDRNPHLLLNRPRRHRHPGSDAGAEPATKGAGESPGRERIPGLVHRQEL